VLSELLRSARPGEQESAGHPRSLPRATADGPAAGSGVPQAAPWWAVSLRGVGLERAVLGKFTDPAFNSSAAPATGELSGCAPGDVGRR
jgi:hypothetical protein